jgi:CopG antitoxin of type II toxin-antitoxin system
MAKKTSPKSKRIPEFASIEEEAAFWDTHSTADYEAEFTPVRVRFAKRLSSGVTIRLDPDTLKQLRTMVRRRASGSRHSFGCGCLNACATPSPIGGNTR